MNDFYYFLIAGAVLMLVPIALIAWLQAGFFGAWFKAKRSRGKKMLVKLLKPVTDEWTTGTISEGFLIFGDKKNLRRIKLQGTTRIYQSWGVRAIDVHDELNAPLGTDYKGVTGFDAKAQENLLVRAITAPPVEEDFQKIFLILFVVIIVLVIISIGFSWSLQGQVSALGNVGAVTGVL